MKKRVFCVVLVLCMVFSAVACAEIADVGAAKLMLPFGFSLDDEKTAQTGLNVYTDQNGNMISPQIISQKDPENPVAYYENSAGLVRFIVSLQEDMLKNSKLTTADECAALKVTTDTQGIAIIIDRYELISIFVTSESEKKASEIMDDILLLATIKETPL